MKRKFIFLAMLLLTLVGGVKWNVLNAQETVTIGDGSEANAWNIPCNTNYDNTLSQQIFLTEDFQGETGSIISYAFRCYKEENINVRNFKIYMSNTDKDQFTSSSDFINMNEEDLVFDGEVTFNPKDEWTVINFDTPFQYNGGNVLLCINDASTWVNPVMSYYSTSTTQYRSISTYVDDNTFDATNITPALNKYANTYILQSQFTFAVKDDGLQPISPTNLTATAVNHNTISLSWEKGVNAQKYNVYQNGEKIMTTKETSFSVKGLSPQNTYCFRVTSVRGSIETEYSEAPEDCATTLEYNGVMQYRIKAVGPTTLNKYLNVFNNDMHETGAYGGVGVANFEATNNQIFKMEDAGNGNAYLLSATGKYIKCWGWNVDAYSETDKTALHFEDQGDGTYKLKNGDTYFKVQFVSYNYYVFGDCNGDGCDIESWVIELDDVIPAVPTNFIVTGKTYNSISLSWNTVEEAIGYNIYNNGEIIASNITGSAYTITGLEDSKTYNLTIESVRYFNKSAQSAQLSVETETLYEPTAPTNLVATSVTHNSVSLSWDESQYAESYKIYINDVEDTSATNSYEATGLTPETLYTFKVKASNIKGDSEAVETTITTLEAPIIIGNGNGTNSNIPVKIYYKNSLTQQIYTKEQLNLGEGTISSISFYKTSGGEDTRNIDVYLINTDKNEFSSTTDWVKMETSNKVYSGSLLFKNGWNEIVFNDGFNYTGGNILLCIDDNTGSYTNDRVFRTNITSNYTALYAYGDYTNYDPANTTYTGTLLNANNQIMLKWEPAAPKAPKAPTNLAVLNDENIFIEKDRDLVLTWDVVENATGYNVYKNDVLVGPTTETTYTVPAENVVYNATPITYAVSAENEVGESEEKAQVSVIVTGYGNINGVVTDKETKEALAGITIWLSGTTAFGEDRNETISLEDGSFNTDVLEGSYTITISHDDYEEYVSTEILDVTYLGDTYIEIELEAKPEAIFAVTATENGNNANIAWNAEYASYNIYRKDTQTGEVEEIGRNISANQYQDTDWLSLENTAYQYGVSANIIAGDSQMGTLIEEGFEYYTGAPLPEGWISNGNWSIISDGYNSDHSIYSDYNGGPHYLITPAINPKNATLSFAYRNWPYWGGYCELDVFYATTPNGQLSESLYHKNSTEDWEEISIDLNDIQEDQIYIIICNTNTEGGGENGLFIDNVVVTGEIVSCKESKINWSNVLKKAVFLGTVDTDWNTAANWSTGQVPGENNNVTIAANAEISSDVTVNTITINDNASLSVNNAVLNVTYGVYNTTAANLIFSDGAQIIQPKDNVAATFNMNINPTDGEWNENNTTGWQFISLPFADAEFEDFTSNSEDYDLYKYNGNKDNEWSNHKYVPTSETITVGTSTTIEAFVPSNINYKYTISQQIYLAEDFNGKSGKITGFSFMNAKELQYNGNPYTATRKFEIYMINTDKSYFENTSDWVNIQASDLVFSGDIIYGAKDTWTTIQFENPFEYNGENVILCVNDISANDAPMATNYHAMTTENKRSIYKYSDDNQYDASNISNIEDFTGTTTNYVAYAQFSFETNTDGDIFGDTFQQGLGYLASYKSGTTATFEGTLNNETTFYYEVSHNADKYLANFHLLGNPFTFNMEWSKVQGEGLVEGYAIVNNEGGYDYLTTGTIPVGDGFFVKANAEDPTLYYDHSYVAPVLRGSEKANSINVIANGKAGKDNVVINFAGQSEGFDKLQNFNKDIATVFVANNGKRYGIANVDENATEVELSFVASQMGHYSISLDVNGEFETVTLVDRFTGIETNMLLEDEYNFTATSNDSHNRFVVRLTNGQEPTANSQFVYQSGEELILSIEGTVQIVDMLGRVVYSNEHANGNNRISVSEFNNAAYVVRVVNEEGVKSQKVVIY